MYKKWHVLTTTATAFPLALFLFLFFLGVCYFLVGTLYFNVDMTLLPPLPSLRTQAYGTYSTASDVWYGRVCFFLFVFFSLFKTRENAVGGVPWGTPICDFL